MGFVCLYYAIADADDAAGALGYIVFVGYEHYGVAAGVYAGKEVHYFYRCFGV